MIDSDLLFFTHVIEGRTYGGWFRELLSDSIEVLAPGFMRTQALEGRAPETTACEALEAFVRERLRMGAPVPSLDDAGFGASALAAPVHHTC